MAKKKRKGFFARLVDMNDESVSVSSVFLIICAIIAVLLLVVPIAGMCVDIHYNHTITISLGELAEYIAAACTSLICGVLQKGWTNYSSYKFKGNKLVDKAKEIVEDVITEDEPSEE